jgi:hypothetical protein
LRLLVVPWGQTTYYGHLRDALFGIPLMEIGVLALAALSFRPLGRILGRTVVNQASAILAFTLLPVANLIPIGMVVGERCLYLPSVAICLLAGAAYVRLQARAFRAAVLAICLAAVTGVALSVRVAFRWQTPLRHWETTAADHNRSAGAHARLALLLLQDVADTPTAPGDPRLRQAEVAVRRALDINPRLAEAWEARALLAIVQQDCAAAAEALRQAASLRPPSPEMSRLLERCRQ